MSVLTSRAVELRYGPDRFPIEATAAETEGRYHHRPFHGIIGRGLLESGACDPQRWVEIAPDLDHLLCAADGTSAETPDVVVRAARDVGTLTFDQSIDTARAAAERTLPVGADRIELWNVKEGHTSSVWSARTPDGDAVAINVARDRIAGAELRSSGEQLLRSATGVPVAAVLDHFVVDGTDVLVQRWLKGATEINLALRRGERVLAAVHRFVTDPADPARIQHLDAIALTVEQHRIAGAAMGSAVATLGARCFEVNDGDWVLHEGRVVLVACSSPTEPSSPRSTAGELADHLGLTAPDERRAFLAGARDALI